MSYSLNDRVRFIDMKPPHEALLPLVLAGLTAPQKSLPAKLFYDETGSKLFERICRLPEYYPTRTEMAILRQSAHEIAALVGPGAQIVEFGAGALDKVAILLDAFEQPTELVALDISGDHLRAAAQDCAERYPDLAVTAIAADYSRPFTIPAPAKDAAPKRVGFFPGSTIGNMEWSEAEAFLTNARDLLGQGAYLVLGADLIKDVTLLEAAYNDAEGITARFNLNMLQHLNTVLGADFNLSQFAHHAYYDEQKQRIEMHLNSLSDQNVRLNGQSIGFIKGESIHTENSHKYMLADIKNLGINTGFQTVRQWTDPQNLFSVTLLRC